MTFLLVEENGGLLERHYMWLGLPGVHVQIVCRMVAVAAYRVNGLGGLTEHFFLKEVRFGQLPHRHHVPFSPLHFGAFISFLEYGLLH